MRVTCVGGGPGGLYAAILLKKADPSRRVRVIDRNPAHATYGWGVVFSDETLGFLEEADPETYVEIAVSFVRWTAIDIHYGGQLIRSDGHAFSGLSRRRLLDILQRRCEALGVKLQLEREVSALSELSGEDLIVAGDGLNSRIRSEHAGIFKPTLDVHETKYIWLGVKMRLDAFTFFFQPTPFGMFQVHAYPFDADACTWIVECGRETWERAGLEHASEKENIAFCQELFDEALGGRELLSNRSSWISFVTLKNETWRYGNIALLGDAAHTAHFSIGSGTKMAMEDAIALARSLEDNDSLSSALLKYEELRQPVVERTQMAARESSLWFEHTDRHARFAPIQFAFSLLTRSKRITYESLKVRDPGFGARVDRWFAAQSSELEAERGQLTAPEPLMNPLRLGSVLLHNRVVASPPLPEAEIENLADGQHLIALGSVAIQGAGMVLARAVAISNGGRIAPGTTGIWTEEQGAAWRRVVDAVHRTSLARIGIQLVHAGRRGATRPRSEGIDIPLTADAWPLVSASPIPYTRRSQIPAELTAPDMDRVVEAYASAAANARGAGFDLLELHLGHGYLLGSFLSPLSNRRTDRYGGSLAQRARFPLAVVMAVRAIWPESMPLSACISVTDWARGGLHVTEAVQLARELLERGCDLIHVVSGQTTSAAAPPYGRAWQALWSDVIRNESGAVTMVGGNISTADEVNTVLAAGRADLCLVAPRSQPPYPLLRPNPPALT